MGCRLRADQFRTPHDFAPFSLPGRPHGTTYERVREKVGAKLIFEETGIQFMPINTIYHLASDLEKAALP